MPNGNNLGVKIRYAVQINLKFQSFYYWRKFIGKSSVALILGDNFFYGQSLSKTLLRCTKTKTGAKVLLQGK